MLSRKMCHNRCDLFAQMPFLCYFGENILYILFAVQPWVLILSPSFRFGLCSPARLDTNMTNVNSHQRNEFNLRSTTNNAMYKRLTIIIMRKNKYSKCTNNIRSQVEIVVGIFQIILVKIRKSFHMIHPSAQTLK